MNVLPQTAERLASLGVCLSIDSTLPPQAVEQLASTVVAHGGHLTIRNADRYRPQTLERIATIGKGQITLEL